MPNCVSFYRAGNACYRARIPVLPTFFKYLGFLVFNSVIPPTAEIGEETKCSYGGIGVVIHEKAIIGKRVVIGQNTTIGRSLDPDTYPTIGDDVYISAGARVIGKIQVGNNVIIGANSVVNKDVPSNSIVAGVPARVIRQEVDDIWLLLKNIKWKSNQ